MKIENIADLRVLIHTARSGSLSAAARALGMTPAAASAALRRLETQVGTRLFERSTRAMRITAPGQTLCDYASRAFELLSEGESQIAAESGQLIGTLRVTSPSDLARSTLLPWIDEFLLRHPGLRLELAVGDKQLDLIRDDVDVAIRYGELADSRLIARKLVTAYPVLCASVAYLECHNAPLVPQDLAHHNCLIFDRGGRQHRHWRFAKNGQWSEIHARGDRAVDDASIAREWAIAGAGITFTSWVDVRRELSSGALIRLLADWETDEYPLHAVLPSGRFIPNRVRVFVDYLQQKFAAISLQHCG